MSERESTVERYLLFDASCLSCAKTAREVERGADGWLTVRGLQEPSMRELLERARIQGFEPTLIIVAGDDVRGYTGPKLAARLLAGVGPLRGAAIVRAIGSAQAETPLTGRRSFLRGASVVAGASLLPFAWTQAAFAGEKRSSGNVPELGTVRRELERISDGQKLTPAAFSWGHATLVNSGHGEGSAVVVPASRRYQSATERIFLTAPYDEETKSVGSVAIQLYERDNTSVTDSYRLKFVDPGKRPIVGITVDEKRGRAEPVRYSKPSLTGEPRALLSYWSCVGWCLRKAWPHLPWYLKIVCGGGCGACIFGLQPEGCAVCAGCLGGYASGCLAGC